MRSTDPSETTQSSLRSMFLTLHCQFLHYPFPRKRQCSAGVPDQDTSSPQFPEVSAQVLMFTYVNTTLMQRNTCIHSVCPSHPETLTTVSLPFFTQTTVINARWWGKAKHSINLSGIARSRGVDLSFVDPLKSPSSKRWSFMCWWRGCHFQLNERNIPTPFYTYRRSVNTAVKSQDQGPCSFVTKEK